MAGAVPRLAGERVSDIEAEDRGRIVNSNIAKSGTTSRRDGNTDLSLFGMTSPPPVVMGTYSARAEICLAFLKLR